MRSTTFPYKVQRTGSQLSVRITILQFHRRGVIRVNCNSGRLIRKTETKARREKCHSRGYDVTNTNRNNWQKQNITKPFANSHYYETFVFDFVAKLLTLWRKCKNWKVRGQLAFWEIVKEIFEKLKTNIKIRPQRIRSNNACYCKICLPPGVT